MEMPNFNFPFYKVVIILLLLLPFFVAALGAAVCFSPLVFGYYTIKLFKASAKAKKKFNTVKKNDLVTEAKKRYEIVASGFTYRAGSLSAKQ